MRPFSALLLALVLTALGACGSLELRPDDPAWTRGEDRSFEWQGLGVTVNAGGRTFSGKGEFPVLVQLKNDSETPVPVTVVGRADGDRTRGQRSSYGVELRVPVLDGVPFEVLPNTSLTVELRTDRAWMSEAPMTEGDTVSYELEFRRGSDIAVCPLRMLVVRRWNDHFDDWVDVAAFIPMAPIAAVLYVPVTLFCVIAYGHPPH